MTQFRFNEDKYLQKAFDYIEGTYGQHYGHEVDGKNIQVVDLWEGMGSLLTTSRDTAIKYLVRFGRKDGFNQKDALKAIHYIVLMMYAAEQEQKAQDAASMPDSYQYEEIPESEIQSPSSDEELPWWKRYPDDGGLKEPVRELGEGFDMFKMIRDQFAKPKEEVAEEESKNEVYEPRSIGDLLKDLFGQDYENLRTT